MFTTELFLTVMLVSGLLLVMTGVDGTRHSCPAAAVVDLTEETGNSVGRRYRSGYVYPAKATWEEDGRRFGCPCDFKTCIRLCCPGENATSANAEDCVKDAAKFRELLVEKYHEEDVHFFTDKTCSTSLDTLMKEYHETMKSQGMDLNFTQYCQRKEWDLILYLVAACANEEIYYDSMIWFLCCTDIGMLFTIATFIVYAVIPELKNLRGSIFLSYLASHIFGILVFTTFVFLRRYEPRSFFDVVVNTVPVFGFFYFAITTMLWLNVMSFDIWRTFKNFQPIGDANDLTVKKRQKRKFTYYAIYAWGIPALYISCVILTTYLRGVPLAMSDINMTYFLQWFLLVSYFAISFCNICLYVSTALMIKTLKKETSHIVDNVNKHCQENEQWFNLYLKLFVIMGGHLIFWAAGNALHNPIFWKIVYLSDPLQGILIFLTLVWKADVRRLLRKRFDEMLHSLGSLRQRDTAPEIQN